MIEGKGRKAMLGFGLLLFVLLCFIFIIYQLQLPRLRKKKTLKKTSTGFPYLTPSNYNILK